LFLSPQGFNLGPREYEQEMALNRDSTIDEFAELYRFVIAAAEAPSSLTTSERYIQCLERVCHPSTSPPHRDSAACGMRHDARAGKCCGLKDIASELIAFFGENVIRRLLDGVRPGWDSDLRTARDRHLSHVAHGADGARTEARC
jgi:hypothetical protein